MEFSLRLEFYGSTPELVLVSLNRRAVGTITSVRGKTAGALPGSGTFQWTSAVRAIATLFAKWSLSRAAGEKAAESAFILGDKGSLAASLDYAFYKNPAWIADMFGCDGNGNSLLRRFITRTNPGRKRPGPVMIGVNQRYVQQGEVVIAWDGKRLESSEQLAALVSALGEPAPPSLSCESTEINRIAA